MRCFRSRQQPGAFGEHAVCARRLARGSRRGMGRTSSLGVRPGICAAPTAPPTTASGNGRHGQATRRRDLADAPPAAGGIIARAWRGRTGAGGRTSADILEPGDRRICSILATTRAIAKVAHGVKASLKGCAAPACGAQAQPSIAARTRGRDIMHWTILRHAFILCGLVICSDPKRERPAERDLGLDHGRRSAGLAEMARRDQKP